MSGRVSGVPAPQEDSATWLSLFEEVTPDGLVIQLYEAWADRSGDGWAIGKPSAYSCLRCGALVSNRIKHSEFHLAAEPPAEQDLWNPLSPNEERTP